MTILRFDPVCALVSLSMLGMCPPADDDAVDLRAGGRPDPVFSVAPITFTDQGVNAGSLVRRIRDVLRGFDLVLVNQDDG